MILYESASAIHGRPSVLNMSSTGYFANCFLHTAPRHNWNFGFL